MRVLVLNSGSSSLKASLIDVGSESALVEQTYPWNDEGERSSLEKTVTDAITSVMESSPSGVQIDAVGHRVVHGGPYFREACLLDDTVLDRLSKVVHLAPVHNSIAIKTIGIARRILPNIPHAAAFDTAFHSTLAEVAWRYPVPDEWAANWGIRRYGFHGLSVAWSVREAARMLGVPRNELSLVVVHLGSGCSVTSIENGKSTWTSMGFTPLDGMMMGTRSGSVDPGILVHLGRSGWLSFEEMAESLERRSGLFAISGVGSDLRDVRSAASAGSERAELARQMFVASAAQWIAAAFTWVKPQALVFTGGIGANDAETRSEITARIENALGPARPRSLVVAAREDVVIADAVGELLDVD